MRFVVLTDTNSYITKKYFIFFYMRLNVRILKKYKIFPHRRKKGTEKKAPTHTQIMFFKFSAKSTHNEKNEMLFHLRFKDILNY
jgi:hypothetical protein